MKNWPFENLILLTLVAALPVVFASGFTSYEVIKTSVLLLGGALLLIGWAIRALRGKALRLRGGLLLLPILGLAALAAVSAIWSPNQHAALGESARWAALFAVLLVTLDPLGRPTRVSDVILALSLGAGLASLIGLLQSFGVNLDPLAPGEDSDGLRASFDHARYGAMALAPTLPLLAAGIFSVRGPRRAAPAVALGLVALYVGATGEAHAWIAVGIGASVAALVLLALRGSRGFLPLAGTGAALAVAALLITGGAMGLQPKNEPALAQADGKLVRARLTGAELEARNVSVFDADWGRAVPPRASLGRQFARSTAMRTMERNLLGGVGAGNWDSVQVRYIDKASPWYQGTDRSYPTFRRAHNSYLQLGAELGLLGLGLLALFLVMAVAVILRGIKADEQDGYEGDPLRILHSFGLLGTSSALLAAGAMESMLQLGAAAVLLFVTLGLLLREALGNMERGGLASTWDLHVERGGFERYGVAGALPLVVASLLLFVGSAQAVSDFHKARGDVWLKVGALDRARASYRDALALGLDNDLALYNLAQSYTGNTDDEDRHALLERLTQLRPHDSRVFRELGAMEMRQAAFKARDILKEKGPELEEEMGDGKRPGNFNPMSLLKNVDADTMKQALFHLEKARELHPRDLSIYEQIYNAHVMRRDAPRAQMAIKKGMDFIDEGDKRQLSLFHVYLAKSFLSEQDWKQAKKHYETALELDPQSPRRAGIVRDLEVAAAKAEGRPAPKGHQGHDHGAGPGAGPGAGQPPMPPGFQRPGGLVPAPQPGGSQEGHEGHDEHGDEKNGEE